MTKPALRPTNPCFSSGPCAKRPGWRADALDTSMLGRSHRAPAARAQLAEVIDRSAALLQMPSDWKLGIVPASDTGAVEMALWSLLGPRPVDVLAFESFSALWAADITTQLKLPAIRTLSADYGTLPDLSAIDPAHDLVLAWNGTTSGARLTDGPWLRRGDGLVICDATSAAFAMDLPWDRLDVVTWSWQKALGGEAGHGMLAMSPRALARLAEHTPTWPLPKIFRITPGMFRGDTINTPSMLCVADALDGLRWAESVGGLPALIARAEANLAAIAAWEAHTPWASFLAADPAQRSPTSICLRVPDHAPRIADLLATEGVAHDIASYRDAPPGLRIWGGATVETANIEALLPWLDWAHATASAAAPAMV
ncbi:phosphoserine transaminase [Acidisphaera sp. L21]|uniref:phosphoserine transaminase n=1 Tax=Acidisphaera sp. L21 TaxID=1641851 RepID=UPI00131E10F4|nr:phosphoserine transaminase [Acidisphaera sp. L21]